MPLLSQVSRTAILGTCELLVIINNLSPVSIPLPPNKAEAPLIVDPNAVLSLSVPAQRFQAVARWRCQVPQFRRTVQLTKLPARGGLNRPKAPTALSMVKALGLGASKRPDHYNDCIPFSV